MKKLLSLFLSAMLVLTYAVAGLSLTATADNVIKVACVGDSITEGFTSSNNDVNSYPAQLQVMLGDGYEIKNYGLGGRTAGKETSSPYWNEAYYTESLAYEPDIVIIMLGTNDAASNNEDKLDTYEENMTALIKSYMDLPSKPEIYLATAPKCGDQQARAENVVNVIVPAQKRIAEALDINLVNTYEYSCEIYEYFPDNLHPNDTGYCLLAQYYYTEIFGGKLYDITVKGPEGSTCSSYGQSYVIDSTGEVSFKIHEGQHNISLKKAGYDRLNITVNIPQDSVADFSNMTFVSNLALNATAFDQGEHEYYDASRGPENINDGDATSSWQLKGGDYYSNGILTGIYVGIQFDKPTAFDRVVVTWELGSRCTSDGYHIEYSNDGSDWTEISYTEAIFGDTEDILSFKSVTAKYLRLVLTKGKNSKYIPRLFEVEVYCDQPSVPIDNEFKLNDDNMTATGIAAGTTAAAIGTEITSIDGVALADGDLIKTGCTVTVQGKNYTIIIMGDTSCDGKINSTDFMQVRKQFLQTYEMNNAQLLAADVNDDGKINSTDFMQIRKHFLGLYDINS